jgi:hypothetical protein
VLDNRYRLCLEVGIVLRLRARVALVRSRQGKFGQTFSLILRELGEGISDVLRTVTRAVVFIETYTDEQLELLSAGAARLDVSPEVAQWMDEDFKKSLRPLTRSTVQ